MLARGVRVAISQLKRREFMTLACGAAAWPLTAYAQQSATPVIGILSPASPVGGGFASAMAAFMRGLSEVGYVDGQNVKTEYRFAEDQFDRLPALAADLVARKAAVLAAVGGAPSILAAKAATNSVPIVFANGTDPVKMGIVASLNRPGGNITGATFIAADLGAKRLELVRELVPKAKVIAVLFNPENPSTEFDSTSLQEAAAAMQLQIETLKASSERDIDAAFTTLLQQRADALLVLADSLFANRQDKVIASAARNQIPTVYYSRNFVAAGGLISYGGNLLEAYRQAGVYAGRILKGAKPADLPIVLPTKYELIFNLPAAKAIGLKIPGTLLARADEVIE
jgi:putative tryptophan/tyrosine transport system substrate-binding protein